jgi:hypothetical protein
LKVLENATVDIDNMSLVCLLMFITIGSLVLAEETTEHGVEIVFPADDLPAEEQDGHYWDDTDRIQRADVFSGFDLMGNGRRR